jgi:hypothetical protein
MVGGLRDLTRIGNSQMSGIEAIFVCCPGDLTTGGPELLHQLVDALREIGHKAYIVYFPFDRKFSCPIAYLGYNAPQGSIEDRPSSLIIHPEVCTMNLRSIKRAQVAIWWLSVDNFLQDRRQTLTRRVRLFVRMMLFRKYRHFVQSDYAADFLAQYWIKSEFLTDYLGASHRAPKAYAMRRKNVIVYNPKKGNDVIRKLIENNPEIAFKAIEKLTSDEVAELLSTAKLYVDFGAHPGKDRLPREAAMAGCCVVTGLRGSAAFHKDVPIPQAYKLEEKSDEFLRRFRGLVEDIFQNFEKHNQKFEEYRNIIHREPEVFRQQVQAIFGFVDQTVISGNAERIE